MHRFRPLSLARRTLPWLILAAALGACAVQPTRHGKLQLSIDQAELMGESLHVFRLADGSEGRIRRLGQEYSVKLQQYMRVIPIENATAVVLVGARAVGGRTVLIIQKAGRHCPFTTQLMAIQGADVIGWELGDCQNAPAITATADNQAIYVDFTAPSQLVRYTYRDGMLTRSVARQLNSHPGADSAPALASDLPRATPPVRTPARPAVPPKKRPPRQGISAPAVKEQEQRATIRLILDK